MLMVFNHLVKRPESKSFLKVRKDGGSDSVSKLLETIRLVHELTGQKNQQLWVDFLSNLLPDSDSLSSIPRLTFLTLCQI